MDSTRRWAITGLLCVLLIGSVGLLVYPFSTVTHDPYENELGAGTPPSNDSSFGIEEEIRISADGDRSVELQSRFAVDGEEILYETDATDGDGTTITTSRYTDLEAEWRATRSWTDSADTYEGWLERAGENETIEADEDGYTRLATGADPPSIEAQFEGLSTLGTEPLLSKLAFEFVGEETVDGQTVAVYEPKNGWYERVVGGETVERYRVTDADGQVHLDGETGALVAAQVSATLSDASNYAEYFAARWRGDDSRSIELTYDVHEDASVERPDWAAPPE